MEKKEALKQFIGSLIRYAIVALFGSLVSKEILPEQFSDIVLESTIGLITITFLPIIALSWEWLVKRFNVLMTRYARRAEPETPMREIKAKVLDENKVLPL